MIDPLTKAGIILTALIIGACVMILFVPVVYADTDGTELRVTDQPEKLVIHLGPAWAGVEFELRTDVGVYPQPIAADSEGNLTMELGGSGTYTLRALRSPDTIQEAAIHIAASSDAEGTIVLPIPRTETQSRDKDNITGSLGETQQVLPDAGTGGEMIPGVPNLHLILFIGGLAACLIGLIVMFLMKKRYEGGYDDEDDFDDDE